ncbi:hypothetical protein WD019_17450 [Fictibacillus sp. Mic-4]|uniref:hypothetical protein n=1 Tax=Fictibacillus sp. Mic-4 TaxID=3132826 RepID=UPI003CEB6516
MFYRFILYLHIFSVILSIGPFFVLLPFVKKLRTAEQPVLNEHLGLFRFVVRLAKHSGHVLVVTGILLVWMGPWTWKTSWIDMTLLVMISSLFFLARAFSPSIRKFSEPGHNRETLVQRLSRSIWTYIILLLIMLWFMVTKPMFW